MESFGRYRVIQSLGQGGAGSVYLVEDALNAGRQFALKVLHTRADELLHRAFEREFWVLSSITLPGVAQVYDFGLDHREHGAPAKPFFTRRYVDGDTLDVASVRLSLNALLRIFIEVTGTVAALHRRGVIHGDLKPKNIVIDPNDNPTIIDFGLARLYHEGLAGLHGGTYAFMAPEVRAGANPSVLSDVYALGATLHNILTSRQPASDESALHAKLLTLTKHATEPALHARMASALDFQSALHSLDKTLTFNEPGFISPQPRGQHALLQHLEALALQSSEALQARAALLVGEPGQGKSTFLTQLKWRLQLRGVQVVETSSLQEKNINDLAKLLETMLMIADLSSTQTRAATTSTTQVLGPYEHLVSLAQRLTQHGPLVFLIDDCDELERTFVASMLTLVGERHVQPMTVIATASDVKREGSANFATHLHHPLPLLDDTAIDELARETNVQLDARMRAAVIDVTHAVPSVVLDVLRRLSEAELVTTEDILALPQGRARMALAAQYLKDCDALQTTVLKAIALFKAPVDPHVLQDILSHVLSKQDAIALERVVADLIRRHLVVHSVAGLQIAERAVQELLLSRRGQATMNALANWVFGAGAAHPGISRDLRASLICELSDASVKVNAFRELASDLIKHEQWKDAYDALVQINAMSETPNAADALQISEISFNLGDYVEAKAAAERGFNYAREEHTRVRAALLYSKASVSAGEPDTARHMLDGLGTPSDQLSQILILKERARIALRKGDYDEVVRAAEQGLTKCATKDPHRIDLLTSLGVVSSYRGAHEHACEFYQQAIALAVELGLTREESIARTYLAIDLQRQGRLREAKELYERSREIARRMHDLASEANLALNLGGIAFLLGDLLTAADCYQHAIKLALRVGRYSTGIIAKNNLASWFLFVGMKERASVLAEEAEREASARGLDTSALHACAILAEVCLRSGRLKEAAEHYDRVLRGYDALGQNREVAELLLDIVRIRLDEALDTELDLQNAPAVIGQALDTMLTRVDELVGKHHLSEFFAKSVLYRTRVALRERRTVKAESLKASLDHARQRGDRDLEWQLLFLWSDIAEQQNNADEANALRQSSYELLRAMASSLTPDIRSAFWRHPLRALVRQSVGDSQASGVSEHRSMITRMGVLDKRVHLLLGCVHQMAREDNIDALLKQIALGAKQLAHAEEVLLLLPNEQGELIARVIERETTSDAPLVYSRSIVESAWSDGEPIISHNAKLDARLSQYASVHQRELLSIAAFPIRGAHDVMGVMYIESKADNSALGVDDVMLLSAFADQAALCLDKLRWLEDKRAKQTELEQAYLKLESANHELERLLTDRIYEVSKLKVQLDEHTTPVKGRSAFQGIIARSAAMRAAIEFAERISATQLPVVIVGESGVGKDLFAHAIHAASPRSTGPYVVVSSASLPDSLAESLLFGYVAGAFTDARSDQVGFIRQASGGTLYLDGVQDLSPRVQAILLRVIQDGVVYPVGSHAPIPVSVRFIASTTEALEDLVKRGAFRQDLFYRLQALQMRIAPLRERREDIALLIKHFLHKQAKLKGAPRVISPAALNMLTGRAFAGNVRELEHTVVNLCMLSDRAEIDVDDVFSFDMRRSERPAAMSLRPGVDEREQIANALRACKGNRSRAAAMLAIPRRTFYRRLKELNIA